METLQFKKKWPKAHKELLATVDKMEKHFKNVCDVEFVIQEGELFILQTRTARRRPRANVRFAVDFYLEGNTTLDESLTMLDPSDIRKCQNPGISNLGKLTLICKGLPASPGAATGVIRLNQTAATDSGSYKPFIYVKNEVSPDDMPTMAAAAGILTARGGMTSHAAVVSKGLGKPCVVGCSVIVTDSERMVIKSIILKEGDFITINGDDGSVYKGKASIVNPDWRKDSDLVAISMMIEIAIITDILSPGNVGKCWAIRDYFLHRISLETYSLHDNTHKISCDAPSKSYISFEKPSPAKIRSYRRNLTTIESEHENCTQILKGLRNTLIRRLSNIVGIGNHHKYFRPLLDPMNSVEKIHHGDYVQYKQLIGEEYFSINKYLPYLIDVYNIKVFSEIVTDSEAGLWFLDFTNHKGESLVENTDYPYNLKAYAILVNEAFVTIEDLPHFYNIFRKREYFWKWFDHNRTSYSEIANFLQQGEKELKSNFRLSTYAHELGLLKGNKLTSCGMSLIEEKDNVRR